MVFLLRDDALAPPTRPIGDDPGLIDAELNHHGDDLRKMRRSVSAFGGKTRRGMATMGCEAGDNAGDRAAIDLRDIEVVAPSLHWRYSGVTSTIIALVPRQARLMPIVAVGPHLPPTVPRMKFLQILRQGWTRPKGRRWRVWHARRNNEMIVGALLKFVLRQPWKLVFTSAAQRRHSWLTRWLLGRMDAIIATSDGAASFLRRPCVVIYHGVDTTRFQPLPDRDEAWRNSGLPGRYGLGAFGRLRPQKGTDLLIEAAIRLLPAYPDACLIFTGLTSGEHQAFLDGLRRKIAAAGLEKRIVFLGERPGPEMPHWFALVSIYVAPMRNEGFGLTPLEAMASGAAVVASATGAAVQLVAEGETGLIVPPGDLEALVGALDALLADPERVKTMGQKGRQKALERHDVEMEARQIVAVYQQTLGSAAADAGLTKPERA